MENQQSHSNNFNVLDKYKTLSVEEIRKSIKRFPMSLASYNVQYGSNMGGLLRASNAFGCLNYINIGSKKWDRRASVGVQHYETIVYFEDWDASLKWMKSQNYTLVGVDWIENVSKPIHEVSKYDGHTVFIMGSERNGLPTFVLEKCDKVVHIEQFGSVRSLNVVQAGSIILNHWHECRRRNDKS